MLHVDNSHIPKLYSFIIPQGSYFWLTKDTLSPADYYTLSVKLYNLGNLAFEIGSYASLIQTFSSLPSKTQRKDSTNQVVFIMPCICPTSHRTLLIVSVLINLIGGSIAKLHFPVCWCLMSSLDCDQFIIHFYPRCITTGYLQSLICSTYHFPGALPRGYLSKRAEFWGIHLILLLEQWQCTWTNVGDSLLIWRGLFRGLMVWVDSCFLWRVSFQWFLGTLCSWLCSRWDIWSVLYCI